ncbi:MAG: hypothetical protein R3B54_09010 [Bdellovibrionota bacterium]
MLKLILFISRVLNFLPAAVGRTLGRALGLCWFYLVPIRRRTVLDNLRLAFPEKDTATLWSMARQNYVHYGLNFYELLCSFTWSQKDFSQRVALCGEEPLLRVSPHELKRRLLAFLAPGQLGVVIG